jgi:hypothetical protein
MMRQHLSDMFRLQDRLNKVVNPDWLTADYPWYRAIYMEAAELLEGYGWKWWKASPEADIPQLQLELVDIWHFALSHILSIHQGDYEAAALEVADYFSKLAADPNVFGEINTVPTPVLIDLLVAAAANQRQLNGPAFNMLMNRFGLTWDTLYTTYVAKNVLNLFRQANGYKEGTYRKVWAGEEDNVVLERLMATHADYTPDQLLGLLAVEYARTEPVDEAA